MKPNESVKSFRGVNHLAKDNMLRVFANMKQASAAAARVGGEAYQSPISSRFLVRFND